MKRFVTGARVALSGLREALGNPRLKRAYTLLSCALALVSLAGLAAALFALFHFTPIVPSASGLERAGFWALRVVGVLLLPFFVPILSVAVLNLLFPVFSEIPFFAGLEGVDPDLARRLAANRGLPLTTVLWLNFRRLVIHLGLVGLGFAFGFVPVVGAIVAPPLQFYLIARLVGWELLDPYFDKTSRRLAEQKRLLAEHRPEVLGFGAVSAVVLAVPLVGPLFFGVVQAGAARFVVDVLERSSPSA